MTEGEDPDTRCAIASRCVSWKGGFLVFGALVVKAHVGR